MAKPPTEPGAADPGDIGMEKAAIKKMLKRSQTKPVNCALAQGDAKSGSLGLILLDKIKPPKNLVRDLKEKFPGLRTPVFGTATVDVEEDAKMVTFTVNKAISGLDRRVRKSLKGTGYSKVTIGLAANLGQDDEEA